MIKGNKILLTITIATFLLSSCVTRKKYDDLNASKSRLETEKSDCDEQLKIATSDRDRLTDQLSKTTEDRDKLIKDTTLNGDYLRKTQRNYSNLNDTYDKLLKNHDRLLSNSNTEKSKLTDDLGKREKELMASEKQIQDLTNDLKDREAKVQDLEKVLAEKDKAVNNLKNKVSDALLSFKEKDLTINVKNGKVYVSLAEQLLFKSGSTTVDPKGAEALKKLAEVLKGQDDISVMVEGHTDDVPIAKLDGIKDNWDLSVLRATAITRILTNAGVNPKKVVPAGRGETTPVAEGKTPEARAKNRRTEIILTPKLDELFQILGNN